MKKLKTWQIILLIVFSPVGICYLIYWLCTRGNRKNFDKMHVIRDYVTKVAGVTFGNDDGSSRQKLISKMTTSTPIAIKPTYVEGHPEAIGVYVTNGKKIIGQIGFLSASVATEIMRDYHDNIKTINVASVHGGGSKNYGCSIHIVIYAEKE